MLHHRPAGFKISSYLADPSLEYAGFPGVFRVVVLGLAYGDRHRQNKYIIWLKVTAWAGSGYTNTLQANQVVATL
jgi:hypothetical protein